jgi:AcrR family transcriptional regulator
MSADEHPAGTRDRIVEAALETLKTKGFAGASAREIARTGGFNQALIFYHCGTVQNALLGALDLVSDRRMLAYRPAFEQAHTLTDLAILAREIYTEDLDNGHVTALAEMVAAGLSNPELGAEVAARMAPWIDLIEQKIRTLVAGSLLELVGPPRDLAFAIVAFYLGTDMLGQLDGDHSRAQSLLDLGVRYAPVAEQLLPRRGRER